MKITKQLLREIIEEEVKGLLNENTPEEKAQLAQAEQGIAKALKNIKDGKYRLIGRKGAEVNIFNEVPTAFIKLQDGSVVRLQLTDTL